MSEKIFTDENNDGKAVLKRFSQFFYYEFNKMELFTLGIEDYEIRLRVSRKIQ